MNRNNPNLKDGDKDQLGRSKILIETARVQKTERFPENQIIIKLESPRIASVAQPGTFVHIKCALHLNMRRPMSIMRVSRQQGSFEILFKVSGQGTQALASCSVGDKLDIMGPIGRPFKSRRYRRLPLLIGGGVGIPPIIFLADNIRKISSQSSPLVLMGSEIPFPFKVQPSRLVVPGIPDDVIGAVPLLEDWKVASRLASNQSRPGCYEGNVTELAEQYLDFNIHNSSELEIFACGPIMMLKVIQKLASKYKVPCEISLEEHMACAVGGCAGCTVETRKAGLTEMKRVCVDGPVFDASSVVFTNSSEVF
jgi:dihydroorotate dehydrogenase electron transfer subunit